MLTIFKKVAVSFLLFLIIFTIFAPNFLIAKAASPSPTPTSSVETWYNSSFATWYGKVYDPSNPSDIFGERYTAAQVQWVIYGIWGFLVNGVTGPENSGAISCLFKSFGASQIDATCIPPTHALLPQIKPIASKGNLWSAVFADRSVSGISYVREKVNNFRLVPVAHAATVGFGYDALQPIQGMWKVVRDISFGFFVIIAVIFAFMIMFRIKINPQTIITVQSAIPKIILSLVLVTFSYAIAGFMIDLMYVVIGLVSVIGSQFLLPVNWGWTSGLSSLAVFNFLTLGQPLGFNINVGILGVMVMYIDTFILSFILVLIFNLGLVGSALAAIVAIAFSPVLLILAMLIIIVLLLVILWISLKTLWALMKAFATVLILTIFAPIQITLGTFIPNFGFGSWLRNYLAALSVFVVTGALLLFAYIFLFQGVYVAASGLISTPGASPLGNYLFDWLKGVFGQSNPRNPLTGNANGWPPLLGIGSAGWMGLILLGVSFMIYTLIPKATEIVQGFITGKQFAYGSAVGQAIGPIASFGAGAGTAGLSMWVAKREEGRRASMGQNYEPEALTQALRTLKVIRS